MILKTNNIEALSELILGDSNVQSSLSALRAKNPPSRQEQKALFETLYRSLNNCLFGYNGNSNITNYRQAVCKHLYQVILSPPGQHHYRFV